MSEEEYAETANCQICGKVLRIGDEVHEIAFSYRTFYFCSEKHAKQYAEG